MSDQTNVRPTIEIHYPYIVTRWPRGKGIQISRVPGKASEDARTVVVSVDDLVEFEEEMRALALESPGLEPADYFEKIFQLNNERVEMQSS